MVSTQKKILRYVTIRLKWKPALRLSYGGSLISYTLHHTIPEISEVVTPEDLCLTFQDQLLSAFRLLPSCVTAEKSMFCIIIVLYCISTFKKSSKDLESSHAFYS